MVGLDRFHHVSALISGRFRRIHSSTHPQGCGTGGVLFLSINQSLSLFIFNFLHSVVRGISKKLSLITLRDREECFFLSFPGTQRTLRDQCPGIRWVPSSLCASLSIHQYFEWRPFFYQSLHICKLLFAPRNPQIITKLPLCSRVGVIYTVSWGVLWAGVKRNGGAYS